jgi:hypothetical protein
MTAPKTPPIVIATLSEVISALVHGRYRELESNGAAGLHRAGDLAEAIANYGETLIMPPEQAFQAVQPRRSLYFPNVWRIDFDLWTAEQGKCDLTLSVEITVSAEGSQVDAVRITGVHVL